MARPTGGGGLRVFSSGEEERCIISCGGGIVEMPQAVSILGQQRYVVWLRMDEDDVVVGRIGYFVQVKIMHWFNGVSLVI